MQIIIMKFGGSSVANAQRIQTVANIIKSQLSKKPIVVLSALNGTTNNLIDIAHATRSGKDTKLALDKVLKLHYDTIIELGLDKSIIKLQIKELEELVKEMPKWPVPLKTMDKLMSFGERLSVRITAAYLEKLGVDAKACDAFDVGMLTDSNFSNSEIIPETLDKLKENLKETKYVPIVTGFIGKDTKGNITTLGRGGSDYTASLIGSAVKASEIQIWTNTNGIMTADPKIVDTARNITDLSYDEELELEALGANTLHPRGIKPAFDSNITVKILNTLNPEHPGTTIKDEVEDKKRVTSITHKSEIYLIKIHTTNPSAKLPTVFDILENEGITVDTLSASRTDINVILSGYYNKDIQSAIKDLEKVGKVKVKEKLAKVSVVGKSMARIPSISGMIFSSIEDIPIEAISPSNSSDSQSFLVKEEHTEKAIKKLHKMFFGA